MAGSRIRVRRSVAEKRRVVELTLAPGASVAAVARAEGVNANQVFEWRRAYSAGRLTDGIEHGSGLLPVIVSHQGEVAERTTKAEPQASAGAAIHIELPGRALISVEGRVDAALLRAILESLRK
jgi:transposase